MALICDTGLNLFLSYHPICPVTSLRISTYSRNSCHVLHLPGKRSSGLRRNIRVETIDVTGSSLLLHDHILVTLLLSVLRFLCINS